jgi:hypothetical protein
VNRHPTHLRYAVLNDARSLTEIGYSIKVLEKPDIFTTLTIKYLSKEIFVNAIKVFYLLAFAAVSPTTGRVRNVRPA